MRSIGLAMVALAVLGSALTLALGGTVPHETIQIVNASDHASPLYGELRSGTTVGYAEDFSGWFVGHKDRSVDHELDASDGKLTLSGSFHGVTTPASISVFKNIEVDIATYPILEAQLNVTSAVSYGLRFVGQSNGTPLNVWWESSPLDHRPGKGHETIRVNMVRHTFLATGRTAGNLTQLQVYVEARPNTSVDFRMELRKLHFTSETVGPMTEDEDYRAVYLDLGNTLGVDASWSFDRIQFGTTLDADSGTVFTIYLLVDYALFTTVDTPSSYSHSQLTPSYNVVFYPRESQAVFPELLPKSNASIVLVANTGSLRNVRLDYLDLIFFPSRTDATGIPQTSLALYYTYFVFFLFLLPVGMALIIYLEFFERKSASRLGVVLALAAGLVCRMALAPVTAHVFDMNVLLSSARGWFQYGTTRGSLGPTLPVTFFLYWIPYSFYALIQHWGFNDAFLMSHAAGIVEAIFIKLFPMLMDVFLFVMLLRLKSSSKSLVWASFYFLNPLAIFISSVLGQYEAAAMAFIVAGMYWMTRQRVIRAGVALVASGVLQLLGFVPYVLLLLKETRAKQYKLSLGLASLGLVSLAYPPQRELTYRLLLGISGLTTGSQFSLGNYTLLGSLGLSAFLTPFHPLLIIGGLVLARVSLDAFRKKLHAESILLYTCLSAIAFLLLLNLPNKWIWVLPIGILYAILTDREGLGAFMLVFGTAASFLLISYTVGSSYFLLGNADQPLQPLVEGVRNGLQIFTIMITFLAGLFLAYLKSSQHDSKETLIRSSLLVIGAYSLVYFWIGVYPI